MFFNAQRSASKRNMAAGRFAELASASKRNMAARPPRAVSRTSPLSQPALQIRHLALREPVFRAQKRSREPRFSARIPPESFLTLHAARVRTPQPLSKHEATASGRCLGVKSHRTGIYFAEASSKADECAPHRTAPPQAPEVRLGRCRRRLQGLLRDDPRPGHPRAHPHPAGAGPRRRAPACRAFETRKEEVEAALSAGYDCILGDRAAAVGTFREFVVFDNASCYPECLRESSLCSVPWLGMFARRGGTWSYTSG